MLKKTAVLIVIFSINFSLHSSTGRDTEVQCPLCDTTVTYWMQLSYSIFTHGLDLKPVGAARIPQPVPKCKNCGFVFIEDYFTNEDIEVLKNLIINQKIFSGKENYPDYYYLAAEAELLGTKEYEEIVFFYVCSVWEYSINKRVVKYMEENEMENVNKITFDTGLYTFLKQNAVEKINNLNQDSSEFNNMQLVKLDFLRRLGSFDEAKMLIDAIKGNKDLYQEIIIDIIAFQITLIEKSDMEEHHIDEIEKD